jgi:hypothetical protein
LAIIIAIIIAISGIIIILISTEYIDFNELGSDRELSVSLYFGYPNVVAFRTVDAVKTKSFVKVLNQLGILHLAKT